MGYDYYIRPRPDVDWRDAASVTARREWCDNGGYFRRNLRGGSWLADALIDMGMGFDAESYEKQGPFPDIDDYGCTWDDEGEPVGDRADEYRAALDAHLRWHGPEIPGIPVHKVAGSNDGWIVTREECRAALAIYEAAVAAGKPHPEAFMNDFIPFLRRAATSDGFETR